MHRWKFHRTNLRAYEMWLKAGGRNINDGACGLGPSTWSIEMKTMMDDSRRFEAVELVILVLIIKIIKSNGQSTTPINQVPSPSDLSKGKCPSPLAYLALPHLRLADISWRWLFNDTPKGDKRKRSLSATIQTASASQRHSGRYLDSFTWFMTWEAAEISMCTALLDGEEAHRVAKPPKLLRATSRWSRDSATSPNRMGPLHC